MVLVAFSGESIVTKFSYAVDNSQTSDGVLTLVMTNREVAINIGKVETSASVM